MGDLMCFATILSFPSTAHFLGVVRYGKKSRRISEVTLFNVKGGEISSGERYAG
jgi:hypothetical protein